ncbi:MAG: GAF domain-containing protein [Halolamina sp.]
MSRATDLLVIGENTCTGVGSLLESDGFTSRVREPSAALSAFEEREPDCLVVCTGTIPAALAARASEAGCPIVDCPTGAETRSEEFAARVTEAVDEGAERDRITRLHAGSAELVSIDDRTRLYERAVDIASEILDFDIATVYIREPDRFRCAAATDPMSVPDELDPDHGLTARVFETGDPGLVDDIESHDVAYTETHNHRSGLAVPFGKVGVFVGLSSARGAFDGADLELAELLANHVAQVDARLRAEADLRERQRTITELHEAAPGLIDAKDEAELFERTISIAERVLDFDRSVLFAAENGAFSIVAGQDQESERVPPQDSVLYRTHEQGESYLLRDVRERPEASPAYDTTRSALSVPIGDDAVFQTLSTEPHAFDETDLELAELLASYAGATLSRIRSEQALRESRQVIEQLHTAATEIAGADTEEAVLDRAIDAAEDVLAFEKCIISLREGEMLVPAIETMEGEEDASRPMHISEGVTGKTARTGDSFCIDELHEDDDDAEPVRDSYRSAISVPVGEIGVFQAVATKPSAFDDDDVHLAELLMAHVAVSLERVRAEADLRTQRDRLEALFENVPGAAIAYEMVDGEPVVRRVNSPFEETFGYSAEEVVGESLDEYVVPPEARQEAEQFNERLERGERIQAEVEREGADGPRHFLMQVIPLAVGEDNSRGFAIYTDITEQREREAALRRQNERLDQFASVVSHDLRNPLNVASGYLDLARESGDEEQFDRVERALDRMDTLVEDLLTLAREGQDVGETEPVPLDDAARRAWSHVASDGATLSVETEHTVEADPDRLIELLENLYRNSVEHGSTSNRTESGDAIEHAGEAPTVTVSDLRENGYWRGFAVADDGEGIDPDIDPFETGVTTSEEGTGFGLAIVESIAEAHGWSVEVTESESGGARFEFFVE